MNSDTLTVRDALVDRARNDLLAYMLACDPNYAPSRIHVKLAGILQETLRGKGPKRLIISMPPRHGKSKMVSEEVPSFFLGHNPGKSVGLCSYASSLSAKASRAVRRRVVGSQIYRGLFPRTQIPHDASRQDKWETTLGGGFQAVGIGGGFTGHGADLLIIDDPHKDRAEAESPVRRENVWDWFVSTASTRLSPDGIVLVISTRWHMDDLIGRLTNPKYVEAIRESGQNEEEFVFLNYKALSEGAGDPLGRPEGASLWPERWTAEKLRGIRARVGSYEWNSLYCGDPRSRASNDEVIKKLVFIEPHEVPEHLRKACSRSWDLATSDKQDNDYVAGAQGAYEFRAPASGGDRFFITHMARFKSRWLGTKEQIGMYGDRDGQGSRIRIEAVGQAEGLFDEVKKARLGKNIVTCYKPTADKVTRSLPWIAAAEAGQVFVVKGDWNADFIEELRYFPNSAHDDQIDAVSGLWESVSKRQKLLIA